MRETVHECQHGAAAAIQIRVIQIQVIQIRCDPNHVLSKSGAFQTDAIRLTPQARECAINAAPRRRDADGDQTIAFAGWARRPERVSVIAAHDPPCARFRK
jgi:hypothetical protein